MLLCVHHNIYIGNWTKIENLYWSGIEPKIISVKVVNIDRTLTQEPTLEVAHQNVNQLSTWPRAFMVEETREWTKVVKINPHTPV